MNKVIFQILLLMPMILVFDYPVLANQSQITEASVSAEYDYSQYDPKATLPSDYQDYKEVYDYHNYNSIIDIFVKNKKTSQSKLFITLPDIFNQHYHYYEYHNGNVYLIKRIGDYKYPSNDWTDELWKYDYQKKGTRIASGQGLDFRVSPDEKYVMIKSGNDGKFRIINLYTKQSKNFTIPEILTPSELKAYFYNNVTFVAWSDKSDISWVALTEGPGILMYIKIIPTSWDISKYNMLGQIDFGGDEGMFNPNNGKLVYSDIPFFYWADQAKHFYENKYKVNLFVYDLNTQKNVLIDKSIAKKFDPKWIDDNTIEYNNPNGEGRIKYVVK